LGLFETFDGLPFEQRIEFYEHEQREGLGHPLTAAATISMHCVGSTSPGSGQQVQHETEVGV
jgi:hypothetical protein